MALGSNPLTTLIPISIRARRTDASRERFMLLGMSVHFKLLLVCHCERQGGEVIRIISALKATKRESAFYRGT